MPKTRNSSSGASTAALKDATLDSLAMLSNTAPSTSKRLSAKMSRRAVTTKTSESASMPPPPVPPTKRSATKLRSNSTALRQPRKQCTRSLAISMPSPVTPFMSDKVLKTTHAFERSSIASDSEIMTPPPIPYKRASDDMPSITFRIKRASAAAEQSNSKRGLASKNSPAIREAPCVKASCESLSTSESTSATLPPISSASVAASSIMPALPSTLQGAATTKPPAAIPSTSRGISNASRLQRNAAEKQRRDKVNGYINQLANLVPMVAMSSKRLDKTSILRLSAAHLRLCKSPLIKSKKFKAGFKWCPSFLNPDQIREILESVDGFLIIAAPNGKILFTSRSVERYLGYQDIDMIGHSVYKFIHPFDVDTVKNEIDRLHKEAFENDGSTSSPRTSFCCRMKEKGQPRSEVISFQNVRLTGDVTVFDDDELPEHSSKNSTVITHIFKIFVRIVGPNPYDELFPEDDASDEYITRHSLDGTIIFADQRISFITGYLSSEVIGQNAYNYILSEDIPVALFAHHLMFSNNNRTGMVVYRLRTKDDKFIYLKSVGSLQYKKNTNIVDHFVCINQFQSEVDGKAQLKCFANRYIPQVKTEPAVALFEALRALQISGFEQGRYPDILNAVKKKIQLSSSYISNVVRPVEPPKTDENISPYKSIFSSGNTENTFDCKAPTTFLLSRQTHSSNKPSTHLDTCDSLAAFQKEHNSAIADNLHNYHVQKISVPCVSDGFESNNIQLQNCRSLSNFATELVNENIEEISDIKRNSNDVITSKYEITTQENKSLEMLNACCSDKINSAGKNENVYIINAASMCKQTDTLMSSNEQIFALNESKQPIINLGSNLNSSSKIQQFCKPNPDLLLTELPIFGDSSLTGEKITQEYTASSASIKKISNEFYSSPKMLNSVVSESDLLIVDNQTTSIMCERSCDSNISLWNSNKNLAIVSPVHEMKTNEIFPCEDISMIDPSLPLLDDSPFAASNWEKLLGPDGFMDSRETNVSLCPDRMLLAAGEAQEKSKTVTTKDISSVFKQR